MSYHFGFPYGRHPMFGHGGMGIPRGDFDDIFWPMEMVPRRNHGDMLSHMFDNWDSFFDMPQIEASGENEEQQPSIPPPDYGATTSGEGDGQVATTSDQKAVAKPFQMDLNLKHFKPNEIKVKTRNGYIVVDAETERKHEDAGLKTYMRREFHRAYQLPPGVKDEDVKCSLNRKGLLRLSAPLPAIAPPPTTEIPISMEVEDDVDPKSVEEK